MTAEVIWALPGDDMPDVPRRRRLSALVDQASRSGLRRVHVGEGPRARRDEAALWELLGSAGGRWAVTVRRAATEPPPRAPSPQIAVAVELETRDVVPLPRGRPSAVGSGAWGVSATEAGALPAPSDLEPLSPSWVRFPLHLINAPMALSAVAAWSRASVPVIASDPFAEGRLDGAWLASSPVEGPPRPSAADWAVTRAFLVPVVSLGFLTQGTGRTLRQAALAYLRGVPGVVGVLVPTRTPQDLRGLEESGEPLTQAERDRVERPPMGPADVPGGSNISAG